MEQDDDLASDDWNLLVPWKVIKYLWTISNVYLRGFDWFFLEFFFFASLSIHEDK